jgi:transposase-like protein
LADPIRQAVLMYVRHPLSLPRVEDLLFGRDIDIYYDTMMYW